MSFSCSPSKSQLQSPQNTHVIPPNCSPNLLKRMQQEGCFICKQLGHWSWYCPSKSPNSKPVSPSTKQASPVSSEAIQCRCGHGACETKVARCGRKFYTCPIKRGTKCKDFVKWCDDPVAERDLQPPPMKYPECPCKAGVCRRVNDKEKDGVFKYYFTCPVKKGHGSCGYRVWEDEVELLDRTSIVPIQRSRQRTLTEFWEGRQNDETDDELGGELSKRMRVMDYSEGPSAVPYIPDKEDAGAALTVAKLNCNGFPDLVVDDDEFTNPVSWETIEEEAVLLLSRVSTPSRIRWRQIMFERRISSDVSFGSCRMGWLGRLLFFHPAQSLKLPLPKPFFCCIFPSFNPIIVPKQRNLSDLPCNQLAIKSVSQRHAQFSTGCHTEVSGHVVGPSKSQDGERKSKASRHRVILFTQQQLLADLETLAPHEHESMKEAAETAFAILNDLRVDYKKFSGHVLDYINFASSIAEIHKSNENILTMEDLNKLFEEEKMRFALLQHDHAKTKALLKVSQRHRQLLCEQVSNLEAMLNEKQNQLKFCELETLEIEARLADLERNIFVTDVALKERAEQTKVAKKQSEERQAKQIAAQEALQKAKLELEI